MSTCFCIYYILAPLFNKTEKSFFLIIPNFCFFGGADGPAIYWELPYMEFQGNLIQFWTIKNQVHNFKIVLQLKGPIPIFCGLPKQYPNIIFLRSWLSPQLPTRPCMGLFPITSN